MKNNALFSSKSDLWGTPLEIFRLLDQVYDFQLDAASTDKNCLCHNHFTADQDGLQMDWSKLSSNLVKPTLRPHNWQVDAKSG